MKTLLVVLLMTSLLFACDNNKWDKAQEDLFLTGCVPSAEKSVNKDAANKYCECMLSKLKAKYSSYSDAKKSIGDDDKKMQALAIECQPANPQ